MAPPQIEDTQLRTLHGQGHSQAEIARILGMPRSTVRDRLKKLDLVQPGEKKNPFCVRPSWHIMTPYAQTTLPEE